VAFGALNGTQSVSIYSQNLQPATTYHYRLAAHGPGGSSYGADQTFATASYPASVIQQTPVLEIRGFIDPSAAPKPLTKAQKLAKALKACQKDRSRTKRAVCEKRARKRYQPEPRVGDRTGSARKRSASLRRARPRAAHSEAKAAKGSTNTRATGSTSQRNTIG
jgi:hypothetical protein